MACHTTLPEDVTEIQHNLTDCSCWISAKFIRHVPNRERERLTIASDAISFMSRVACTHSPVKVKVHAVEKIASESVRWN